MVNISPNGNPFGADIGSTEIADNAVSLAKIASGTAGDILYWDASGDPVALAKGTSGHYLKQGASIPAWAAVTASQGWVSLEVLSPSAAASATTGTLTAYDEYMLRYVLTASTTQNLSIQLNADSGANYNHVYLSNTTVVNAGGSTSCVVGQAATTQGGYGVVVMEGITKAAGGGGIGIVAQSSVAVGSGIQGVSGLWSGGNAQQITSITLLASTGTFTGTIEVLGRNRYT